MTGLRIGRTRAVFEAIVPAIIGQKVTSTEAGGAYRALIRTFGEPAPGPGSEPATSGPAAASSAPRLRLLPAPEAVARLPYHAFHPLGLERRRAETLIRVARVAGRLEEATGIPPADAYRRLLSVAGIGPWTAAKVGRAAFGDPDVVLVGDFHLPNAVCWALAGEPRGDDARMLELLEPYRGQRGRVIALIGAAGIHAPRYGPPMSPRRIEDW
jgi:3-methyladenine DNA glycosylase/8-oxoguanine DNA glycosylase